MNRANFATPLSIAPFGLGSVITTSTRWQSHEDWSDDFNVWFGEQRPLKGKSFGKSPKIIRSKSTKQHPTFACWILTLPGKTHEPIAWAELHGFPTSFAKVFLLVSAPNLAEEHRAYFREALLTLITAAGIWGRLDLIDTYFLEPDRAQSLEGTGATNRSCVMVDAEINDHTEKPMTERFELQTLDMYEWGINPLAEAKRDELSMLKTRVRLKEKRDTKELDRKGAHRRGILERLFNPWKR